MTTIYTKKIYIERGPYGWYCAFLPSKNLGRSGNNLSELYLQEDGSLSNRAKFFPSVEEISRIISYAELPDWNSVEIQKIADPMYIPEGYRVDGARR